jgi:hypothetical protein
MGNPISKEVFLARAISRFGDHYDYSIVSYRSYKSPIKIKCKRHPVKEIVITPERHLHTTGGCKYCLREVRLRILERGLEMTLPIEPPRRQKQGSASRPAALNGIDANGSGL